ncbi:MAG: hypothetical protein K2K70_05750 [Lachnospiraceae bacterium]|nr:hypothetical protein [Lachnospiraceae bacterium]
MLFQRRKTKVRIVDQWEKSEEKYAPGVLISVSNGQGLLKAEQIDTQDSSHLILSLGNQPLMQLQGAEYFCPTCEKILKSAYGLEQSEILREQMQGLNHNEDFVELVKSMMPFWELLSDGCYILLDTKLYPTDGNGHLFWNVPNLDCTLPGTCIYCYRGCEWGNCRPHFTTATQAYKKMNPDRVEYYEKHPQGRALAYHMDGYMTALIDGHHKTMAAAKTHQMVDALVIIPCYIRWKTGDDDNLTDYVGTEEWLWSCSEYGIARCETKIIHKESWNSENISSLFISDVPEDVKPELDKLAAYYPDVQGVASIDLLGEITDQRLDNIIHHQEIIAAERVCYFLEALVSLKHHRTIELFDFFLHENAYDLYKYDMIKEIVSLNADGKLTDYFIDVMVEYEDDYPEIKDLLLDYIW